MERRLYAGLALVFALLWMPIVGCNPGQLSMLLMPFASDKVQPKCKLASKDKSKEVTLAVVCNFANNVTRHELIGADQDLAEKLMQALAKNFKDNKDKVKIVPPGKVRAFQSRTSDFVSEQDVGRHFKVDYVIGVDVMGLNLYAEGTSQLFRAKIDLTVRALDMSKAKGEGQEILGEGYSLIFPGSNRVPIETSSSTPAQFRGQLMSRVASDLARWFSAYPKELVRELDD